MSNDSGDFAVLAGKYKALAFRGSRKEVYEWLLEHNELDRAIYTIMDCSDNQRTELSEEEFEAQFEEYLKQNPEPEHKCLSEEDVRRIFREELARAWESAQGEAHNEAHGLSAYENGDFHRIAFDAFSKLAEIEKGKLPHAWDCELRDKDAYPQECTCGVEDESDD